MSQKDELEFGAQLNEIEFKGRGPNVAIVAVVFILAVVFTVVTHRGFAQISRTVHDVATAQQEKIQNGLSRQQEMLKALTENQRKILEIQAKQTQEQSIQTWLLSLPPDKRPEFIAPTNIGDRIK